MAKREWEWRATDERNFIIIDNRFQSGVKYKFDHSNHLVWLDSTPSHKWHPLVFLPYSERFTWEEFEEYAQVLTDRLNAHETEKILKGGG